MFDAVSRPRRSEGMRSKFALHTQWGTYEAPTAREDGEPLRLFLEFREEPQMAPRVRMVPEDTGRVVLQVTYPSVVVTCLPRFVSTRAHVRLSQWVRQTLGQTEGKRRPRGAFARIHWPEQAGPNRREDRLGDCCRAFSTVLCAPRALHVSEGGTLRCRYESVILIGLCNLGIPDRWVARADWQADLHVGWTMGEPAPRLLAAACGFCRDIEVAANDTVIAHGIDLSPTSDVVLRQVAAETPASSFVNACM